MLDELTETIGIRISAVSVRVNETAFEAISNLIVC